MMKYFAVVVLALAGVGMLSGCGGLSKEQQERLDKLMGENQALSVRLQAVYKAAQNGTATVGEVEAAVKEITTAISANQAEIKKLQDEGAGGMAWLWALIGMFGRTVLHAGAKIPLGGPLGVIVQSLLGLLLGGSQTAKKEELKT